jgi:starvation-inducible DNA-binding protein
MDKSAQSRRSVPFKTPTGLGQEAVNDISAGATTLLADVFAL